MDPKVKVLENVVRKNYAKDAIEIFNSGEKVKVLTKKYLQIKYQTQLKKNTLTNFALLYTLLGYTIEDWQILVTVVLTRNYNWEF